MSFNIEEKSFLPLEQDHNSVPELFYERHDPITQVRGTRFLAALETSSDCVRSPH